MGHIFPNCLVPVVPGLDDGECRVPQVGQREQAKERGAKQPAAP